MNGAALFARVRIPKEMHETGLKCDMRSSLTYKLNMTVVGVNSSLTIAITATPSKALSFILPDYAVAFLYSEYPQCFQRFDRSKPMYSILC